MSRPARLEDGVVDQWVKAHGTWRRDEGHLVRVLPTKDYPGAVALLQAQVPLAQRLDHHPQATVSYRELRIELWTHDQGGITQLDLDYAEDFDTLLEGYAHLLS
jgi:4a-hydroxytetrahydrobiopterin dehydratase